MLVAHRSANLTSLKRLRTRAVLYTVSTKLPTSVTSFPSRSSSLHIHWPRSRSREKGNSRIYLSCNSICRLRRRRTGASHELDKCQLQLNDFGTISCIMSDQALTCATRSDLHEFIVQTLLRHIG